MTSKELKELIEREIAGDWQRSNAHGCILKDCLVEPCKELFVATGSDKPFELWVVLEEPKTGSGYKIVFDEDEGRFGLASPGEGQYPCYHTRYQSFLDAYDGM